MSYLFGTHEGHLTAKASRIARKHDAWHVNYTEPGTGRRRGWFGKDQRLGAPFDQAVSDAVLGDIEKAGGIDAFRVKRDRQECDE